MLKVKENKIMISAKDVWVEIKNPKDIKEDDAILMLIYKAVYMGLRLLLDVRYKLYYGDSSKPGKYKGKPNSTMTNKKIDNAVLKPTDIIKVEKNG